MAYCLYCGAMLPTDARFCSSCGAAVTQETAAASVSPSITTTVYTGNGYAVMLVGTGSCPLSTAADLISDTCGYTDAEAMNLVSNAPTLIAQSLNQNQAAYLAQCLTEYGMEAAIYDRNGAQTFSCDVDTVFSGNGSLLTKVASILSLIGIGNRIAGTILRLTLPVRPPVYTLRHSIPKPPVRRHEIHRVQAPLQSRPQHPNPPEYRSEQKPQEHRPEAHHQEPRHSQGQHQQRNTEQPPHGNRHRSK